MPSASILHRLQFQHDSTTRYRLFTSVCLPVSLSACLSVVFYLSVSVHPSSVVVCTMSSELSYLLTRLILSPKPNHWSHDSVSTNQQAACSRSYDKIIRAVYIKQITRSSCQLQHLHQLCIAAMNACGISSWWNGNCEKCHSAQFICDTSRCGQLVSTYDLLRQLAAQITTYTHKTTAEYKNTRNRIQGNANTQIHMHSHTKL